MICYDLRIPELSRTLCLDYGVDLLLHSGAYFRDLTYYSWRHFAITRALENQVYVLSLNRAGQDFGGSIFCAPWIDQTQPPHYFGDVEPIETLTVTRSAIAAGRQTYPSSPTGWPTTPTFLCRLDENQPAAQGIEGFRQRFSPQGVCNPTLHKSRPPASRSGSRPVAAILAQMAEHSPRSIGASPVRLCRPIVGGSRLSRAARSGHQRAAEGRIGESSSAHLRRAGPPYWMAPHRFSGGRNPHQHVGSGAFLIA
ncbi:carbon-nitrogen hydrolase family protein [Mesorhizobium sp. M0306]|uniref:carbon-nitrogen hydrolase family protein n=1 Tax=Mesorhizobium sp. M0306 TaxID=2956932 RepID=UPI003334AC53